MDRSRTFALILVIIIVLVMVGSVTFVAKQILQQFDYELDVFATASIIIAVVFFGIAIFSNLFTSDKQQKTITEIRNILVAVRVHVVPNHIHLQVNFSQTIDPSMMRFKILYE